MLRLLPLTLCLGCSQLPSRGPVSSPEAAAPHVAAKPAPAPEASRELLAQAARHLDAGDEPAALPCLTRYLDANPDHATIRTHLAELLLRLNQPAQARQQLERYIADAQRLGGSAARHLVHSHTRLVEIAAEQRDDFAEHLYRGIGLFLVAESLRNHPDGSDDRQGQRILFQAIAELKRAAAQRPDEPRPYWYMHECWSNLGQSQPARAALNQARRLAPLGGLTPCEEQALNMMP